MTPRATKTIDDNDLLRSGLLPDDPFAGGVEVAASHGWEPLVPFGPTEPPAFPVETLPAWLADFVRALSTATQTPPDLPALLALAAIAVAVAKRIEVVAKPGWREPLNVFAVVALPPANRKSAVFAEVTRPLSDHEREECARLAPELAAQRERANILEKRLISARTAAASAKDEKRGALEEEAVRLAREHVGVAVQAQLRLVADDVTPEKLAGLLAEQGGRVAVMSAEGGVFALMGGRYGKEGAPNFEVYLKGHAGDDLRVDRIGRPAEHVRAPALTLGLAVQPEALRGLNAKPGFRGRGLLGRFLYAVPTSTVGRRDVNPPSVPEAARTAYDSQLRSLLRIPEARGPDGELVPTSVHLAADTRSALDDFSRDLEPRLGEGGDLNDVQDWAGKLAGAVVRIAGLLHAADNASSPEAMRESISVSTMERAIRIGRYLVPHARTAFSVMGGGATAHAQAVADWLAREGRAEVTKRAIFRAHRGRFQRVADLEPVLDALVEHGHVRLAENAMSGPGRPSERYSVHPDLLAGCSRPR